MLRRFVTNQAQNIDKIYRMAPKRKRLKSEATFSNDLVEKPSEQIKKLCIDGQLELKQRISEGIKCDTTTTRSEQPDGYLKVEADELNLELTLMGGQSFRWKKSKDTNNCDVFTGIILDHVLQLWRPTKSEIAFKLMNKESKQSLSRTQALLENYFRLEHRLVDLYKDWASRDEHLANCLQEYKGFRILRQDPEENVFSFICATNNNIKRISQMVENMCKKFGSKLEGIDGEEYHAFPSVEQLATDDDSVFQALRYELGFGYRAKHITESARYIMRLKNINQPKEQQTGRDYLLSLRQIPYEKTREELVKLRGIGRKVADCICLMSMNHLQAVPVDCHIYSIVRKHYLKPGTKEVKSVSLALHNEIGDLLRAKHGPLAGWSSSVLFISELKHLDSAKVSKKSTSIEPVLKKTTRKK